MTIRKLSPRKKGADKELGSHIVLDQKLKTQLPLYDIKLFVSFRAKVKSDEFEYYICTLRKIG
jgi:hypothetical protein